MHLAWDHTLESALAHALGDNSTHSHIAEAGVDVCH
jgi:hypothetical protein